MLILLLCATLVPVAAQTEKSHILIYKLDSTVDTLLLNNVRNIYHSCVDEHGVTQPEVSTLRLRTVDGERVYPLTEIDYVVMPKSGRVISFLGTSQNDEGEGSGAPRRTAISGDFPDGQTYLYQWVTGDYIYLSTGDKSRNVESPYSNLSYKSTKGEFTFASDSLVADQYIIFYSGTNRGDNDHPIPYNKVKVATTQTQNTPDNSEHLGASGDCGVATAIRQNNSNYSFVLDHKTAVICFMPRVEAYKGTLLNTLRLKRVAVKADKDIAGTFTLSPEGLSATPDESTGSDTITLLTNNFNLPIPHQKGTAQDSVASYMVVAPQSGKTNFKVYYRIYDVQSEIDTVVMRTFSINNISGAKVYPVTQKIDPHILFAAQTDSVKWDFNQPATLYGSINLPLKDDDADTYTGFIWGYNQNLTYATKQADINNLTPNAGLSFNSSIGQNVRQTAYYYRAYAHEGGKYYFGKVKKFGMDRDIINMGTSVRWSSINMGAITKEDAGDYYAWGELTPKDPKNFSQANYQYYQDGNYVDIGSNIVGNPQYDAATALWRGCWRMPTRSELEELRTCNWTAATRTDEDGNDVAGWLVKSKTQSENSDSTLFIPKAGYYNGTSLDNFGNTSELWTGNLYDADHNRAHYLLNNNYGTQVCARHLGLSIRPVFDSNIETPTGEYLFIRTDGFVYDDGRTEATLYGTLRGIDDVVTEENITQGFVVGTTEDVTLDSGNALKFNYHQTPTNNGSYNMLLNADDMTALGLASASYIRAYLTYKGHTYYGGAVKMEPMELTTDSTNWQVNETSARLCGTAKGISESIKDIVELGFVVGTTADVTLQTENSIELVSTNKGNGKFVAVLDNIELKQYYYRAFLRHTITGQVYYGEPKMLGLEFIDLGLPSGLKWANINVGSQTPSDRGVFYAWGEVTTRSNHSDNAQNYSHYHENIGDDIGGTIYDAAQVNWKGPWRMPSKSDFEELAANCTQRYTTYNGRNGYLFTSKINGKTIFLPATGYHQGTNTDYNSESSWRPLYWTSTRDPENQERAYTYEIQYTREESGPMFMVKELRGSYGFAIRPVAMVNNTLDDESMIQMTTDGVDWEVGQTRATLHGYLLGLRYNPDATESGIAYSTDHISDEADDQTEGINYLKTNEGEISNVASGNFICTTSQLTDNTVYYYRTYVKVAGKYYYANERQFGRKLVDLGLTSGTLWSNINMGASSCDDSGDYYAWGETEPKSSYTKSNYTYTGKQEDISGSSNDVAHVKWGGAWRMPTRADLQELVNSCTWTEVTLYGRNMYKVEGPNGNFIYIAKRGSMSNASLANDGTRASIWTSNLNTTEDVNNDNAYGSAFYGNNRSIDAVARYLGYTVRPVVKYTHTLEDQTKIYLTTDSTNWQVGITNPRLVGSVVGLDDVQNVTRGFVVGYKNYIDVTTPDMSDTEHITDITATTVDATNSVVFRGTTTYDKDTTYYYRAYVKVGETYYFGNVRRYGLELVDMGNGIKWASINVGAQTSSDAGNRYAWGETTVKSNYSQNSYRYYSNGYEIIGSDISSTRYDAAKANWGGSWRMPTLMEMNALLNTENYTWTWTTVDGVAGYQVTSQVEGTEGNSIFLPAAGYQEGSYYKEPGAGCYYWTSTLYNDGNSNYLHGNNTTHAVDTDYMRYLGFAVRPVTTASASEGGGGGITGGAGSGNSGQTGGEGTGTGGAGSGDTGSTIGN